MIPLVVTLWEEENFRGTRRIVLGDIEDISLFGFNDKVHSIQIHPGPDYAIWQETYQTIPSVALFQHSGYDGHQVLLQGSLGTLRLPHRNFNGRVSSLIIAPQITQVDFNQLYKGEAGGDIFSTPTLSAPVLQIPLIIELYQHADFAGQKIILLGDSYDLAHEYGESLIQEISSVRVLPGPHFAGQSVQLFSNTHFQGHTATLAQPGEYPNLRKLHFNDKALSLRIQPA